LISLKNIGEGLRILNRATSRDAGVVGAFMENRGDDLAFMVVKLM